MSSFEPATDLWLASAFRPFAGAGADSTGASSSTDGLDAMFIPDAVGEDSPEASADQVPGSGEASQQAVAAAYDEGRQAGVSEAMQALDSPLRALDAAVARLATQRSEYLLAQRRLLVDLAIEIAGTLIGRELDSDRDALSERVARALALLPEGPARLALHPDDHAYLTRALEADVDRFEALRAGRELEVVADAALELGDALVSSGFAQVDARMSSLLERLRDELSEVDASGEADEVDLGDLADQADQGDEEPTP